MTPLANATAKGVGKDWELHARAVLAGYRLEVVPYALYWYRTNAGRRLSGEGGGVTGVEGVSIMAACCAPPTMSINNRRPLGDAAPYISQLHQTVQSQKLQLVEADRSRDAAHLLAHALRRLYCRTGARSTQGTGFLLNSGFDAWSETRDAEDGSALLAEEWVPHVAGYTLGREDRGGAKSRPQQASRSMHVHLANIGLVGGGYQFVMVEQQVPEPLLLQGWSRVLEMDGNGEPIDYSLYADIHFVDGTQHWAYYTPFDQLKDGWQHTYGILDFQKPIVGISIVALFRYRGGTVIFDDIQLSKLEDEVCSLPDI
ncbi:hypothetical protein CYMTET_3033 [Cymbomonas tetramitiformis]|uniref:Uncharacterized protein n=1 Tax=Cymbomonas tetramitiformis TaxID=36881 RepID=A0AAE0H4I6_9CHLO|nr:hypothetical protein CYMTET_3033 [Cymbomonas tetramitiformis]